MAVGGPVIDKLVRRLGARGRLADGDREALEKVPFTLAGFEPAAYLVREGEPARRCLLMMSGFSFRQKVTSEGARQILSLHLAGDFVDLQNLFLETSDHNVQALTRCEVAIFDSKALQEVALSRPAIGRAMWIDALIDASVYREWIVNVGRRDARARIAHILCEFSLRMAAAGVSKNHRYELPMTQEQLADAVGLTSVHVNRTLRALMADGLIERDRRYLSIGDWDRLRGVGDFTERYLHLDQGGPDAV